MPELPEVETVRASLEKYVLGERIARVDVRNRALRQPIAAGFEKRLAGRTIRSIERRAKYLLLHLDNGLVLLSHLGMSGAFHVCASAKDTRGGA